MTAAKFLQAHNLKWAEVAQHLGPVQYIATHRKVREANKILDEHGVKVSIEGTGFFKVPARR